MFTVPVYVYLNVTYEFNYVHILKYEDFFLPSLFCEKLNWQQT